jgi:uncharacterized protein (UPF0333 family)
MKSEKGSASLEFIAAGVLLIVPLIYLVLVLGRVQAGTLAAESIARQAVRVYVTAPSAPLAISRVSQAASDTLADFHFVAADATTTVSCAPVSSICLRSASTVTVTESITVSLPFVPAILGLEKFARVTVTAQATQRVALGAGV